MPHVVGVLVDGMNPQILFVPPAKARERGVTRHSLGGDLRYVPDWRVAQTNPPSADRAFMELSESFHLIATLIFVLGSAVVANRNSGWRC